MTVAGQLVASNGVIARVHSGYATNIVPLTVQPHIGSSTNFMEVQDTNGTPVFTINSNGAAIHMPMGQTGNAITIGTNSGATFSIMGVTNGPSPYLVQIGSPIMGASTGGTNAFLLRTNANAIIGGTLSVHGGLIYIDSSASGDGFGGNNFIGQSGSDFVVYSYMQGNLAIKGSSYAGVGGNITLNSGIAGVYPERVRVTTNGLAGIGTNNPQAILHVQNNIPYTNQFIAIFDSTNKLSRATLDTNGNLTVAGTATATNGFFVSTPTNYGGNATTALITNMPATNSPIGLFGYVALGVSNIVTFPGSSSLYTNVFSIASAARLLTNGFVGNLTGGYLTNCVAGYYKIQFSISVLPDNTMNSDDMEAEIFLNETTQEYITSFATMNNGVQNRLNGQGIVWLPAGTGISLRIVDKSRQNVTLPLLRASITVGTP